MVGGGEWKLLDCGSLLLRCALDDCGHNDFLDSQQEAKSSDGQIALEGGDGGKWKRLDCGSLLAHCGLKRR